MPEINAVLAAAGIKPSYLLKCDNLYQISKIRNHVVEGALVIIYVKKNSYNRSTWSRQFYKNGFKLAVQAYNRILNTDAFNGFGQDYEVYCFIKVL